MNVVTGLANVLCGLLLNAADRVFVAYKIKAARLNEIGGDF